MAARPIERAGNSRNILACLAIAHFFDHYFLLIFPTAVLAIQSEWQLTYGELLTIGSTTFISFAVFTLPAGWLGDRWSRLRMMQIFFIGCGAAAIIVSTVSGPLGLGVGLGLLGAFAAIYHPVATAMVIELSTRTGQALAVNGVCGNMGVAFAALITAFLTTQIDWRAAFAIPGVIAIIMGLVFGRIARPSIAPQSSAGNKKPLIATNRQEQWRLFVVIGCVALLSGFTFNGLTVGLPKLLQDRLGQDGMIDLTQIGALTTVILAVAAFAQLPVGWLLDRIGAKPILLTIVAIQTMMMTLLSVTYGYAIMFVAAPLMLVVFGEIPITSWLIGRHVAQEWRSRAFSLNFLGSLGLSTAAVPLMGYLYDQTGSFTLFLQLLATGAAILFAAAWLLPHQKPVTAPQPV